MRDYCVQNEQTLTVNVVHCLVKPMISPFLTFGLILQGFKRITIGILTVHYLCIICNTISNYI